MSAEAGRTARTMLACGVLLIAAGAHAADDWTDNPLRVSGLNAPAPDCAPLPDDRPLSLSDALEQALCRQPQLAQSRAAIRAQAAALGEARAAYLPSASATVNQLDSRTAYSDSSLPDSAVRGRTLYASLSWRLFDFGGRDAGHEAATILLDAALAGRDATAQRVVLALIEGYFNAEIAAADAQARHEAVDRSAQILESAQQRERGGAAAVGDVLQARAAWARARLAAHSADADARKAAATLATLIGLPPEQTPRLPAPPEPGTQAGPGDLARWLDEARRGHPALRAALAQRDAARAKVRAVRSEGLPTLDLTWNQSRNGYPNQGLSAVGNRVTTFGLSLTVPLFEGFARQYKIRAAQAQVDDAEARGQDIAQQIGLDVVKAHAEAVAAQDNLQASEVLLDAADAARDSARRRYLKGAADIAEWLNAQNGSTDARLERQRCLAEWASARLRLGAAAGRLDGIAGSASGANDAIDKTSD